MIERLNFYDVYGYLLPGLTLLGILWFPLWFIAGRDLPAAWSSAFVVLVLGYVAGHVLGRISGLAFPHGRVLPGTPAASPGQPGAPPRRVQPSDYVLEPDDRQLAREVKDALIPLIRSRFGIDAATPTNRNAAFMLCRRALLQSDVGSYAEQFEGLYTLMRGWTAVGWLSTFYHLGWAIGPWLPAPLPAVGSILLALGLIAKSIVDYRGERQIRRLGLVSRFRTILGRFVCSRGSSSPSARYSTRSSRRRDSAARRPWYWSPRP